MWEMRTRCPLVRITVLSVVLYVQLGSPCFALTAERSGGLVDRRTMALNPSPRTHPTSARIPKAGSLPTVIIGIAALVYIGIWLFLNRTIIGKAIRAGTEDVEHVEGLGINVYRLFTITFVIAGGLSGLAGGLQAPLIMVDPQMGLEVLAFVFMVVIIGGLGSIKGTLISSFLVGQVVVTRIRKRARRWNFNPLFILKT